MSPSMQQMKDEMAADSNMDNIAPVEATNTFSQDVIAATGIINRMLIEKNAKYGNSALEPIRIFSKASPMEQILVRLDDKLSRLRTQHINEDEDVLDDLIGYLILLKISQGKHR